MKAVVDENVCIGCGLCNSICPEVFSMNVEGKAQATDNIPDGKQDEVKDAESSCPVNAISVD